MPEEVEEEEQLQHLFREHYLITSKEKRKVSLMKKESLADEFAVKTGDTVYFNHEEYTVREISKNQITRRNDLWIDPARSGNLKSLLQPFTDNEDLLRQVSPERPALSLEMKLNI